ncbi:MAG: metallophosphoesterase [Tetrasphaera sp.]
MAERLIGLAGDWHGDTRWAVHSLERFATNGATTIHHVGDFGFWPGRAGTAYASAVSTALQRLGLSLAVTPGNHEDYSFLQGLESEERSNEFGMVPYAFACIAVLPRGHRWTHTAGSSSRTFVSLGGSASVDLNDRIPGLSWWPEEAISDHDVERTIAGGRADVMLCHDSPEPATPAVTRILAGNPLGWPQDALRYAASIRSRLTQAVEMVRPEVLVHGHYHVWDHALVPRADGGAIEMVSLDCERSPGNLALLDLVELTVRRL